MVLCFIQNQIKFFLFHLLGVFGGLFIFKDRSNYMKITFVYLKYQNTEFQPLRSPPTPSPLL